MKFSEDNRVTKMSQDQNSSENKMDDQLNRTTTLAQKNSEQTDSVTTSEQNETQPTSTDEAEVASSKLIPTKKSTLIWMLLVLIVGIIIILWAWRVGPFNSKLQQTDNSYVRGQTTILSSQINGYVKDVLVQDFDYVKKGQPLMHIDATTYDQKVTQAESSVDQAKNSLANQSQTIAQRQADIAATQAKVEQANAQYQLSAQQLLRYQQLGNSGAASKTEQDQVAANVKNNRHY